MERIGIFGGTFNPVHREHVKVACSAVKELNLDRLFIMPDYLPPHKDGEVLSASERLKLLNRAFLDYPKIEISDYEIEKGGKSYTFITAEEFKKRYQNAEIFFIVGGDMLVDFKTWKHPEIILQNVNLAVFDRLGVSVDYEKEREYFIKNFQKEFVKLKFVGENISSTRIRVYCALNLNVDDLLTKEVSDYIVKNGLYRGGKEEKFIIDNLKESRIYHTAGVMITALSKAKELNLNERKVYLSALLHDSAKYLNPKDYKGFNPPKDLPSPVVHAFLGEYVAKNVLGIDDAEILDAIKYHTSGKANMSVLGKLIFLADMIEPNRDYKEVAELRELFNTNFEKCFDKAIEYTMEHLIKKGNPVYNETVNAYNYYVKGERK